MAEKKTRHVGSIGSRRLLYLGILIIITACEIKVFLEAVYSFMKVCEKGSSFLNLNFMVITEATTFCCLRWQL